MDMRFLDKPLDDAKRMADVADDLLFDLGSSKPLAERMLAIIGTEYLIDVADRHKIRRVMKALAYVSAAVIAANGEHAVAAHDAFQNELRKSITAIRRV